MTVLKKLYRFIKWLIANIRREISTYLVLRRCATCDGKLTVNFPTTVTHNTYLGSNVNFNGLTISGLGRVDIGDNFHSGKEIVFITQIHNYDQGEAIPYDATYIQKDIVIHDNVWLGNRVMIMGGVEIGEGVIIQAGSVVVSDIPAYSIAGGHPAKVFSQRNVEHYKKLKAQGKFH